jgi:hypothetical protein
VEGNAVATVIRRFTHTTIEEDPQLGLLVRAMHPDQELAGDWRWAGDCPQRKGQPACRWAFNTYHGKSVRVVLDEEATMLASTHVTRPLWDAWRLSWPIEQRYWRNYFESGQGARDDAAWAALRKGSFEDDLEALNEQARRRLGPA